MIIMVKKFLKPQARAGKGVKRIPIHKQPRELVQLKNRRVPLTNINPKRKGVQVG